MWKSSADPATESSTGTDNQSRGKEAGGGATVGRAEEEGRRGGEAGARGEMRRGGRRTVGQSRARAEARAARRLEQLQGEAAGAGVGERCGCLLLIRVKSN